MPALGIHDEDIATLSRLLDVFLRNEPRAERRHSFLTFFRGVIDSRIRAAEHEVEIERRRTPPPRRPSGQLPAVEMTVGNTHPDKER